MKAYFFIFLYLMIGRFGSSVGKKIPRIGIIGGGIGGTSCAYFLRSLFGNEEISIDLYEAEKIGGRLSVVNFSNKLYEEGGSIIHPKNKYMLEFLEKFKLHKRQKSDDGYFGLYDGKDFVFSESSWEIKTMWDIAYRYGLKFWRLLYYINDMLAKFERIYDLQSAKTTYNTVGAMLTAMDPTFVHYLHITAKQGFEMQDMPPLVIDEIIMATIRANYGQTLSVQKMVGSVSVAGALGGLWAVDGGNVQIPQNLLEASKANLINLAVTSVKNISSGQLQVTTKSRGDVGQESREYDIVILAAPQTSDAKYQIDFLNFTEDIKFVGRYHKTVCTLIEGTLSESYFPTKSPIVDEIFSVKEEVPFNSIGLITPVDYTPEKYNKSNVWKIFTQEKMPEAQIMSLFSEVKNKYVREWLAYPHYDTSFRNDSFILAPNLYHINAIEWAASAMEMSVIGAKNVALLAYKNFMAKEQRAEEIFFENSATALDSFKQDL